MEAPARRRLDAKGPTPAVRAHGHLVTRPSGSRHLALRLLSDVELLQVQTIADVRMNQPVRLYDPPGPLSACESCAVAYERARRLVEQAGGLAQFMEKMCSFARA